jgi:hypothetical protein
MFYLRYLCLFGSSLPSPICRRIHVLFTLFVFVQLEVKTNQTNTNNVNKTWILLQTTGGNDVSNKHKKRKEDPCFIYVICVCLIRLYLRLFVGGSMFYLCYLCLFGSSLPPPICNVNKTWILLQTGGGKDEPNKHK